MIPENEDDVFYYFGGIDADNDNDNMIKLKEDGWRLLLEFLRLKIFPIFQEE